MITVVSLNPSIDRTLMLPEFKAGSTNRAQSVRVDAGGKGVNVCLHLKALGAEEVRCVGFMRRAEEPLFTTVLEEAGVQCRWLTLPGHVRTNTKICTADGELTEINESGEPVPVEMVDAMFALCQEAFAESDVVVLTGSVPPGVPKAVYAQMIEIAHQCGAVCLLDADGEALQLGIAARPMFIKPNREELERLMERELPGEALLQAIDDLNRMGIARGCISMGGEGALFFSDVQLYLPALNVPVRSTVGAGDAMIAAFALGAANHMGEKETFCLAVAASAAAVSTNGTQPINGEQVHKLMKYVPMLLRDAGSFATISRSAAIVGTGGVRKISEPERIELIQQNIARIFE